MVRLVATAWSRGEALAIEAGTGVGKSLAYLVPAALAGRRVVVATATKNLQDQLARTRRPGGRRSRGRDCACRSSRARPTTCAATARGAVGGGQLSFDDGESVPRGVAARCAGSSRGPTRPTTGDRDELTFEVDERAWRGLSVTPQECLGRTQCPQGAVVLRRARQGPRRRERRPRRQHPPLRRAPRVGFDAAAERTTSWSSTRPTRPSTSSRRCWAPSLNADAAARARQRRRDRRSPRPSFAERCRRPASAPPTASRRCSRSSTTRTSSRGSTRTCRARSRAPSELVVTLVEALRALDPGGRRRRGADDRARSGPGSTWPTTSRDCRRRARRRAALPVAARPRGRRSSCPSWTSAPRLRDDLWAQRHRRSLTSATVPDTLPRALGLDGVSVQRFASPFDYQDHALLYVPAHFPERRADDAEAAIVDELVDAHRAPANGRTLALFTNRSVMNRVAEQVEPRISTAGAGPGDAVARAHHRRVPRRRRGEPLRGHELLAGRGRPGPLAQPGDHRPPALRRAQRPAGRGAPRPRRTTLLRRGPAARGDAPRPGRGPPDPHPRRPRRRRRARHAPGRGELPRRPVPPAAARCAAPATATWSSPSCSDLASGASEAVPTGAGPSD